MGVVIAYRTIDLAQHGDCRILFTLAAEAGNDVCQFLANRCRCRGLSMGTCQHRFVGIAPCQFSKHIDDVIH